MRTTMDRLGSILSGVGAVVDGAANLISANPKIALAAMCILAIAAVF